MIPKALFYYNETLPDIQWELREASLRGISGEVVFEQKGIEAPSQWSQSAIDIVASKYFSGKQTSKDRESSIKELIHRVTHEISTWSARYLEKDSREDYYIILTDLISHQFGSFNSPVWFNVGIINPPQCSACFILGVEDHMESLLDLQKLEAMLFKFGSGTGSNLSSLRSSKEHLTGGGKPAGPVAFMRGYDAWAQIVRSGGRTRRAAKMQILDVDHPDIYEFINCKMYEEEKVRILSEAGYSQLSESEPGAYDSVWFQNSNLSIRVTDPFMLAAEKGGSFETRARLDDSVIEELSAKQLLRDIATAAHACGDPGIQFDSTINAWNTCAESGRIRASNPCGEYLHLDNTACNLASLNLLNFLRADNSFDLERYLQAIRVFTIALDSIVENSGFPSKIIGDNVKAFREIGLGFANLGALLMSLGIAYDSDEGREIAASLSAILTGEGYRVSSLIAKNVGAFSEFSKNRDSMLHVIEKHNNASQQLECSRFPEMASCAKEIWNDVTKTGKEYGFRNSQISAIAPTGTIAFMMDCDTTGIEPDLGLSKVKSLVGGGVLQVQNRTLERGLTSLGYEPKVSRSVLEYVTTHGFLEGAPGIQEEHIAVFDCALPQGPSERSIHWKGHIGMMAAVQPFISGGISKTVNISHDATVEDVENIYLTAWKKGLKSITVYRDGSKFSQPLKIKKDEEGYTVAVCDETGCS